MRVVGMEVSGKEQVYVDCMLKEARMRGESTAVSRISRKPSPGKTKYNLSFKTLRSKRTRMPQHIKCHCTNK